MDPKLAAYLAIGDLILRYGLPAALKLIQTLQADTATVEDIRALAATGLKPAAQYFDTPTP